MTETAHTSETPSKPDSQTAPSQWTNRRYRPFGSLRGTPDTQSNGDSARQQPFRGSRSGDRKLAGMTPESDSKHGRNSNMEKHFGGFLLEPSRNTGRRPISRHSLRAPSGPDVMHGESVALENTDEPKRTFSEGFDKGLSDYSLRVSHPRRHDGVSEDRLSDRQLGKRIQIDDASSSKRSSTYSHGSGGPRASSSSYDTGFRSRGLGLNDTPESARSASATLDPSALVRMALSLNESRKMQLSPGLIPSVETPTARRAMSLGVQAANSPELIGSLQQHLREQRRAARKLSNGYGPASSSITSPSLSSSDQLISTNVIAAIPEQDFMFSAATLSRAEKARTYFELCHQYRRVLDHLPSLDPKRAEKGNVSREYNPLQYIRNRKIRVRERKEFKGEESGWADLRNVAAWADAVEAESQQPGFKKYDVVRLPKWNFQGLSFSNHSHGELLQREATDGSNPSAKPRKTGWDWSIDPADLLADLYWTEEGTHKAQIEDRHGDKIYSELRRPSKEEPRGTFVGGYANGDDDDTLSEGPEQKTPPDATKSPKTPKSSSSNRDSPKHHHRFLPRRRLHMPHLKGSVLARRRHESIDNSDLSHSDDDKDMDAALSNRKVQSRLNTGPLEAHMDRLLQEESHESHYETQMSPTHRSEGLDGTRRRLGMSGDPTEDATTPRDTENPLDHILNIDETYRYNRTDSVSSAGAPRISVEHYGNDEKLSSANELSDWQRRGSHIRDSRFAMDQYRAERNSSSLFSSRHNSIAGGRHSRRTSIIPPGQDAARKEQRPLSARSSFNESSRSQSYESLARVGSDNERLSPSRSTAARRFFKGGRIGELVRGERSGSVGTESQPSSFGGGSHSSFDSPNASEDQLQTPSKIKKKPPTPRERPGLGHMRSKSAQDIRSGERKKHSYHMDNLPAFISAKSQSPLSSSPVPSPTRDSMPLKQPPNAAGRRRKSRFDHLAPLSSNYDSSDVSPNTSSPDLTRLNTNRSYGFSEASRTTTRTSNGVQNANRRLSDIIMGPEQKHRPSPSPSATVKGRSASRPGVGHRHWSIADAQVERPPAEKATMRDVKYLEALLLSTGVKADAIVRKANQVRDPPDEFLQRVVRLCNTQVQPVRKREQHVVAARLLSSRLEATVQAFDAAAKKFSLETCGRLREEMKDLQERAAAKLTPQVGSIEDEADDFVRKLTTTHTMAVKQVNDEVDDLLRRRRRRLRWLAGTGFRVLELVLVGFMWLIWLFVLVLRAARGAARAVFKGMRWMLWL